MRSNNPRTLGGGRKFITSRFVPNLDFRTGTVNAVVNADWYNASRPESINGVSTTIDISSQMNSGGLTQLASVYIDNGPGDGSLSLQNRDSGQIITCPPSSQGWFSLIVPSGSGSFDVGYTDKYNVNATRRPSWETVANLGFVTDGSGKRVNSPTTYALTLVFTDAVIPPYVWRVDTPSGVMAPFNAALAGASSVVLAGQGVRRKGIYIYNDGPDYVEIRAPDVTLSDVTISILGAGQSFAIHGDYTPSEEISARLNAGSAQIYGYILV